MNGIGPSPKPKEATNEREAAAASGLMLFDMPVARRIDEIPYCELGVSVPLYRAIRGGWKGTRRYEISKRGFFWREMPTMPAILSKRHVFRPNLSERGAQAVVTMMLRMEIMTVKRAAEDGKRTDRMLTPRTNGFSMAGLVLVQTIWTPRITRQKGSVE